MDPRPAFHNLAEDDEDEQVSGGQSLGPTKRWRSSLNVEESHRCSRLGVGGERDVEEHVLRNIHGRNGEVQ